MELDKAQSWCMFNQISGKYDRLNRILSLYLDLYWRKKIAAFLPNKSNINLLDCATGTGDQIFALMKTGRIRFASGVDLAEEMLKIAKTKSKARFLSHQIDFVCANAEHLPYPDQSFDCVTISFGIRNMPNISKCLREMNRVLKPDGMLIILEFSMPQQPFLQKLYRSYLRSIVPTIGAWIAQQKAAYQYLHHTIETFLSRSSMLEAIQNEGFATTQATSLSMGIVTVYQGWKKR